MRCNTEAHVQVRVRMDRYFEGSEGAQRAPSPHPIGLIWQARNDTTSRRWPHRKAGSGLKGVSDLKTSIMAGSAERVRPLLMTTGTTMIGLLPIMFGTETGTRVMNRIAAPMVGGLVSSTLLTLIVLPAIYLLWKRFALRSEFALAKATDSEASAQQQEILDA